MDNATYMSRPSMTSCLPGQRLLRGTSDVCFVVAVLHQTLLEWMQNYSGWSFTKRYINKKGCRELTKETFSTFRIGVKDRSLALSGEQLINLQVQWYT
jgi:hypothetical protein